jgi:hypothetical protein
MMNPVMIPHAVLCSVRLIIESSAKAASHVILGLQKLVAMMHLVTIPYAVVAPGQSQV